MQTQIQSLPSPSVALASERCKGNLRASLADAIANRDAADAAERAAKHNFERADHLRQEAERAAERLKAGLTATVNTTTERHAKAIAEAVRAGKDAPAIHP